MRRATTSWRVRAEPIRIQRGIAVCAGVEDEDQRSALHPNGLIRVSAQPYHLHMRIGELAKRGGVSVQAVRFYERRRLMRTPRRTPAGYRTYTEQDLETVTLIKRMQRFGFTLAEIRRVLQLWILPGDSGGASPYRRGSHECLREALRLGEKKLRTMNDEIHSAIQVRDELMEALVQIRASLDAQTRRKTPSDRPDPSRRTTLAAT